MLEVTRLLSTLWTSLPKQPSQEHLVQQPDEAARLQEMRLVEFTARGDVNRSEEEITLWLTYTPELVYM